MHARKKPNRSGQPIPMKINKAIRTAAGPMYMTQVNLTHWIHDQVMFLEKERMLQYVTRLGYYKAIRHLYERKYER